MHSLSPVYENLDLESRLHLDEVIYEFDVAFLADTGQSIDAIAVRLGAISLSFSKDLTIASYFLLLKNLIPFFSRSFFFSSILVAPAN